MRLAGFGRATRAVTDVDGRGLLRNFGLKFGPTSAGTFDARVRQLVEDLPGLTDIISSSKLED